MEAIQELKTRAEILHRGVKHNDSQALDRLRKVPAFRRAAPPVILRRHCLNVVAAEWGFPNWPAARRALAGEPSSDFGTLLNNRSCSAHFNLWYKTYDEASEIRRQREGYLLGYRHQFLVVDRYYIETLGLDPDDSDWQAIGYDWVRPRNTGARTRLYSKLVAMLPR